MSVVKFHVLVFLVSLFISDAENHTCGFTCEQTEILVSMRPLVYVFDAFQTLDELFHLTNKVVYLRKYILIKKEEHPLSPLS